MSDHDKPTELTTAADSDDRPVDRRNSTQAVPAESTGTARKSFDWRHLCRAIIREVITVATMSQTMWALGGLLIGWSITNYPCSTDIENWKTVTDNKAHLQQMKTTLESMKQEYERKIKEMETSFKELNTTIGKCFTELEETDKNLREIKQETLQANQSIHVLNETTVKFNADLKETQKGVTKLNDTNSQILGQMKNKLSETGQTIEAQKQETDSLKETVVKMPLQMDLHGYITLETLGPLLFVIFIVEVVLAACVCQLFSRFWSNSKTATRRKDVRRPEEAAAQFQQVLVNTNNNNVVLLCFRDDDKTLARRCGEKLLQDCQALHLQGVHVLHTVQDIDHIPPCRAALVFADPDERDMIIENEECIGVDLRRQTVQRLLDSGVEVFIIIFRDKKSSALSDGQMYSPKLGQINVHPQLKQFKRQQRIVSINDKMAAWQKDHLVSQLRSIFT